MAPEITFTREQLIDAFKATASNVEARQAFGAGRAAILLPLIAEQSTIRRIFRPEYIPPGGECSFEIPFSDDTECVYLMPQIGGIPTVQFEGDFLYLNTFGIDGRVQWQERVAVQGRFEVAARVTQQFKNRIIAQEEVCGWTMIKNHAAMLTNEKQKISASGLDIDCFNDIVTNGDELRRTVSELYLSPARFSDIRRWVTAENLSPALKDKVYSTAGLAEVWGVTFVKVYNPRLVTNDKAYAFGSREGYTYGVMPIREELTTKDDPMACLEYKLGFFGKEEVGFGILDEKGLIEVTFE